MGTKKTDEIKVFRKTKENLPAYFKAHDNTVLTLPNKELAQWANIALNEQVYNIQSINHSPEFSNKVLQLRNRILSEKFESVAPTDFEKKLFLKTVVDCTFIQEPSTLITIKSLVQWYNNFIRKISKETNKVIKLNYIIGDPSVFSKKLKIVLNASAFSHSFMKAKQKRCLEGITFRGAVPNEIEIISSTEKEEITKLLC